MSWTKRALEYMNLGLTDEEATALVQAEREAAERGDAPPPLPPKVMEAYGQRQLFAGPDVCQEEDIAA